MATNARIIVIDMSGQYLIANNNTFIGDQITLINTLGAQINNFKTLDDLQGNIFARWKNLDISGQTVGINKAQTLDSLSSIPPPMVPVTSIPYSRMYSSGKHVFNWLKKNILTHDWLNSPAVALGAYSRGIPPLINCTNDEVRLAFDYSCTNFPATDPNAFQNGLSKIKLILKTEQVNFIGGGPNPSDFNPDKDQPKPFCDRNIDETILREFLEETGTDLSSLSINPAPPLNSLGRLDWVILPTNKIFKWPMVIPLDNADKKSQTNYQLYFLKVDDKLRQNILDNYTNTNFYQNSEAFDLRFVYENSFFRSLVSHGREFIGLFKNVFNTMPSAPPAVDKGRFGDLAGTKSGWSAFGTSGKGKKPNFPGGGDPFYDKYLKYKTKYVKLKEKNHEEY
jgi:8-oxo-dGTP pyrophosphatase MutT (NUDIX family)